MSQERCNSDLKFNIFKVFRLSPESLIVNQKTLNYQFEKKKFLFPTTM